ncbi:MAG: TIGR03862 family flavoprotein [Acidimicrobiales bacterium]|nr:TIGR03862 family flavoprotein [Acidimicrobiales bacterium]MDG2218538.1 TIGR03862 family flavoprotein [Acidimicrobiales bacterium]
MTAIVVGAGPAGLMAAERLVTMGRHVTVIDQRRSFGRTLLLAGRSGLNLTHSEPLDDVLDRYGPGRPQLEPMIRAFDPVALRAWADELGVETFVGSSGRVFPVGQKATPLLRAWLARLVEAGVEFRTGLAWSGFVDGGISAVAEDGSTQELRADGVVLALGGGSWPRVGGDGSWIEILRDAGVECVDLAAANAGVLVDWTPKHLADFEGEPLKNVAVSIAGQTIRGEPVVTRGGLEGGPIYGLGPQIRDELSRNRTATIQIDLLPDVSHNGLGIRLETKRPKDSVSTYLRRAGIKPVGISLLREATGNRLPDDRVGMASLVKAVPVPITAMASIDRAISTAGGVAWSAVDESLQLNACPGVYVAGEMLDWEAPTGGYLLQACFSTGAWAGRFGRGESDVA